LKSEGQAKAQHKDEAGCRRAGYEVAITVFLIITAIRLNFLSLFSPVIVLLSPGTIEQSVGCTRLGGEVSVIGFVAGFAGSLNPLAILGGGLNVRGVLVGSKELFLELNDAVRQGHIKPAVGQTFPFEKAADAIKLMESAQHFGKIVIQV
jgi:NADPH:quinone reductase-like Zn-dependent oxidoreductase